MSELITVNPPGTPSTGPTLGLNIINEQPVQVFKQSATGPVVVAGSPGRDVIRVSSPGDVTGYVIEAEAGNDEIIGGAGEDQLSGGAGNDRIEGGRSRDKIFGGNGNDQLFGNEGIDVIDAGGSTATATSSISASRCKCSSRSSGDRLSGSTSRI
ncbi:calcium-binding protein [Leptolyngbya sp. 7M]|uniref:calcium-binding protein n=1 Tax=Leptolyngbya sp. 7M TaxID=2812896 RepID=UPI001B8B1F6B|nr:hypothetical protein [Leptolyngbya sp. 7M]QYO62682.1 hypothetical protein JVX88_21885 [Leptolyngbya sp. 7M]